MSIKKCKFFLSLFINLIIVISTTYSVISTAFYQGINPTGMAVNGAECLKYFSIDSAIVAAISSIFVLWYGYREKKTPIYVSILKLAGTTAIIITFLMTLFVTGPATGYGVVIFNRNCIFIHLITPILCVISQFFTDNLPKINFKQSLLGMSALIIYGIIYFFTVVVFEVWADFYSLTTIGVATAIIAMLVMTFIINTLLWLPIKKRLGVRPRR